MTIWNREDEWFAWYPVRAGALGTGEWLWLEKVWRNRCMGATIYQPLAAVKASRNGEVSGEFLGKTPEKWSERLDSNQRPLTPQERPDA